MKSGQKYILTAMEKSDFPEMYDTPSYADILLDLSPDMYIFLGPGNEILKMNKVACQYFGIETGSCHEGSGIFTVIGNPVLNLLVKKWVDKLNRGMEVDEIFPLDQLKTDTYDWFHVRALNAGQDGRLLGKVLYISRVTELYSQKKILDTLMGSIPGEVLVFDRNLQILLVSDTVARLNGFVSWRELAGKSLRDLPRADVLFIEALIEKSILFDQPMHQVVKYTRPNSEIGWNYVDLRTIKSTAGTFGYIMTQFDITGEIKPKAILEALMDSATDAISIVNPEGVVEYASRSLVRLMGFDNWRSVINHPWNYLLRNADAGMLKYAGLFSGDWTQPQKGTLTFDNPEGTTFLNYQIDPLDYQNENFGLISIATNSTELVAARDKAESAVRAKAAFLANMSHELRTPMNAVLGMNELLSRTPLVPLQKNYVSQIRSSASLLLSIINDILDFSRIEDRKMELVEAPYDINSLLHDVINLVAVKVAEKDLSFTVDLDPSIPTILIGDEIRIKQILINLLNNAVKFTGKGEVNLSVSAEPSVGRRQVHLEFRIRDTGIGIPKEKQAELFERFFRIETSGTLPVEGSGLGLSICKGLVSLMGGMLTLESDEGAGSVFTATISQGVTVASEPIASFSCASPVSLLAYEEDAAALASIRRMAERTGIRAVFCGDLAEFRARLAAGDFPHTHVVFGYKNGYAAVLESVAARPAVKWLALLSMTDFIGAGKDPAVDFIFKPLVLPVLSRFLQGARVDFSVSIPLVNSMGLETAWFRASGVRVLVVDDSTVNRKVAEGFLQTLDIRVDEAESGEEAVRKASENAYDLVLMDHMMPGMDGLEAASRIRSLTGYAEVPIIALTANAAGSFGERYREAGMNDTLYKPIEFTAFVACLKKWLPPEKRQDGEAGTVLSSGDLRAAAGPHAVPAVVPDTDWIPGLDRESGIGFTGSLKNLEMILKVFKRTAPKMLEQLESGRRGGNANQFRVAAHSLISSCANIGAVRLSALARELEDAIIGGRTGDTDRLYQDVHEELEKTMAGVAAHADKTNNGSPT